MGDRGLVKKCHAIIPKPSIVPSMDDLKKPAFGQSPLMLKKDMPTYHSKYPAAVASAVDLKNLDNGLFDAYMKHLYTLTTVSSRLHMMMNISIPRGLLTNKTIHSL